MKTAFEGVRQQSTPTGTDESRERGGSKHEAREGSVTRRPKHGVAYPLHQPYGGHDGDDEKAFIVGCKSK